MKKILTYIFVLVIFIVACNNSNNQEKVTKDTISNTSKIINDTIKKNDTIVDVKVNVIEKYKYLGDIFDKNDSLFSKLEVYLNVLNDEIISEKQITEAISLRDKLLAYANLKTEKFYYSKGENNPELWEKVEKELISIGFLPTYTEGMFVQLDKSIILKDAVKTYASEPFKLKMQFDEEYAKNSGGEYPYSGLESLFEAFNKGYELYTKYSNTKYYKDIENTFRQMILDFVNIHKIKDICYAGDLNFSDYPWMTECDLPEKFLKKFPDNKFAPIFTKLQNNISELNPKESVYLIFVEELKNDKIGENEDYISYEKRIANNKFEKLFGYWERGIDVVNTIKIFNLKTEYLVYRFYSDENKAKEELIKIKDIIPSAKIIIANVDDEEHVNVRNEIQE